LQAIAAKYLKRSLSFSELLQIETEITKLYTDEGYLNSGAFIPSEQSFAQQDAVIKIKIVEAGIEDIKITGTNRFTNFKS
jgi:hemolysin activation/secretion protein